MIYSNVIKNNLHKILKKKNKYTKKDVNILINKGYNFKNAIFIVKCTAIFNKADWSNWVGKSRDDVSIMLGLY